MVTTLEDLFYNMEPPWREARFKGLVAKLLASAILAWCEESAKTGGVPFGSEENAAAAAGMVRSVLESGGLGLREREVVEGVQRKVDAAIW